MLIFLFVTEPQACMRCSCTAAWLLMPAVGVVLFLSEVTFSGVCCGEDPNCMCYWQGALLVIASDVGMPLWTGTASRECMPANADACATATSVGCDFYGDKLCLAPLVPAPYCLRLVRSLPAQGLCVWW
jgi:hypothetical protein